MTVSINGTSGLVFNDASTQNTAATGFGFKNRIINGAMVIDQRNAGASVTPTASAYTLDRWFASISQSSKFSVQQNAGSVTPPVGFTNYLGVTSLSAYTVGASEFFQITQQVEGFNVADLGWGTASAQSVTLSFWVRSSLTGTFGGVLANGSFNRSYPFSFTINAANTWEQKSITITGDTSGTWLTNNGIGIYTMFSLGSGATVSGTAGAWAGTGYRSVTGAVSVVGTNGATFYITGVQLEKGSTATSFDYRPYGTELQLAQRYFYLVGSGNSKSLGTGFTYSATEIDMTLTLPVTMRGTPSISQTTGSNYYLLFGAPNKLFNSFTGSQYFSGNTINCYVTGLSGMTGGQAGGVSNATASSFFAISAEL